MDDFPRKEALGRERERARERWRERGTFIRVVCAREFFPPFTLAKLFLEQRPVLYNLTLKVCQPFLLSNLPMANIDIKYGFIVNLTSMLAIGKFDNKKGIFFIFYRQTSNLTLNFIFARNRLCG
jgi:hypothetical protein